MTNNKKRYSKYVRSRKTTWEAVGPLDDKEVKGMLKEEKERNGMNSWHVPSLWKT